MSNRLNRKLCLVFKESLIGWAGGPKARVPKWFLLWLRRERLLTVQYAYRHWRRFKRWKEVIEDYRNLEDMLDEALFGDKPYTEHDAFVFKRDFVRLKNEFIKRIRSRGARGAGHVE